MTAGPRAQYPRSLMMLAGATWAATTAEVVTRPGRADADQLQTPPYAVRLRMALSAAGVAAAAGLTALVAQRVIAAWWLIVALVIVVLIDSVRRGAR